MKKLGLVKIISECVVSAGVGTFVGNVVKATLPSGVGLFGKVLATIGGSVVAGVCGQLCSEYVGAQIDNITNAIKSEAVEADVEVV